MAPRWTPIATFLLGMTLTIGVYEGLRLVRNTSRALTVASNQMAGNEAPTAGQQARREALERAAAERRPDAAGAGAPQARTRPELIVRREGPMSSRPAQPRPMSQTERRQALRDRLAELSPEELEALRERRLARRDRQREKLQALRALRDGGEGGAVTAPRGAGEPPMDELIDTADPALYDEP